ncbi:MAG: hypothetical protein ACO23B_03355 [Burkholderiaceae bacterium]
MKRTLSNEPSPNASQGEAINHTPNQANQANPPADNGAGTIAPTVYTPPGHDTTTEYPLMAFDENAELPDWDTFERMLPRTPPVAVNRNTENMSHSEVNEDEQSEEDQFDDFPSLSDSETNSDENKSISPDRPTDTAKIVHFKCADLSKQLEVCKQNRSITKLEIPGIATGGLAGEIETENPEQALKILSEFFKGPQNIQSVCIGLLEHTGLKCDAQFLKILLDAPTVRELTIFADLEVYSSEDKKSIRDLIRENKTLKKLFLNKINATSNIQTLLEALADNRSLELLSIGGVLPTGFGEILAAVLKSNKTLKHLMLSTDFDWESGFEELSLAVQGLLHNTSLESLDLAAPYPFHPRRTNPQIFKTLSQNYGLKSLTLWHLMYTDIGAHAAVAELIEKHPTLSSIDVGDVPINPKDWVSFLAALKPNPRLQHIGASWPFRPPGPLVNNWNEFPSVIKFLQTAVNFPNLTSVNLGSVLVDVKLIDFLEKQSQLEKIYLGESGVEDHQLQDRILNLVRNSSRIKEFQLGGDTGISRAEKKFRAALNEALALNRELTSEPKITAASEAMYKLIEDEAKRGGAQPLPSLPLDVTKLLATAIARYVRPDRAKAIFDELILHAPARR